ncbi:MAG: hypothetical protein WCS73_10650, partial [Lentisphaeria bacterium]
AFICGLSALTRGNALLLVPGCIALIVIKNWKRKSYAVLLALLFIVVFELPQLPYSLRNYQAKGHWYGPSVAGGKVLALGNTPEAPSGGLEYPLTYHHWCDDANSTDPAIHESIPHKILHFIKTDPAVWLELKFRMLLRFWDHQEIPNNVALQNEGQNIPILRLPFLLKFSVIGTFALIGLCFCLMRRHILDYYLAYMILMYCASTVAFYILARFRLGCVPLLAITAGYAVQELLSCFQRCRKIKDQKMRNKRIMTLLFICIMSWFMVNMAYSRYQIFFANPFVRTYRPNGTIAAFPNEILLYDHAPNGDGGWQIRFLQSGKSMQLIKTFYPTPQIQKRLENKKVEFRVQVYQQEPFTTFSGTVEHANQAYPLQLTQKDRQWYLSCTIPALSFNNDRLAVFKLDITSNSQNAGVVFDQYHHYYRTMILNDEQKFVSLSEELVAELYWKK